jgi:hypothetical protein
MVAQTLVPGRQSNDKGKASDTARWHSVAECRGAKRAVWGLFLPAGEAFPFFVLRPCFK